MATIDSLAALEALYPVPSQRVVSNKRDRLDDGTRAVVAASPFVLLATSDAQGRCDVSPRGGPPGFVVPLDDHHLALPDLVGNNLLDSLRNVVTNPHAGLLFVVPGQSDTLRVDGGAWLTTDDDVLGVFPAELRSPRLALVVRVEAVFVHCAKAFRRSRFWDPQTWAEPGARVALAARHRQQGGTQAFEEFARKHDDVLAADLALD